MNIVTQISQHHYLTLAKIRPGTKYGTQLVIFKTQHVMMQPISAGILSVRDLYTVKCMIHTHNSTVGCLIFIKSSWKM